MGKEEITTKVIKVKSGSKFEDIASYSRLVCVGNHIYISNTAGRHPETTEMSEDVTEQSLQAIANIERALLAVGSCLADIVAIRVFVPNPADADAVGAVLGERFRGIDPACTLTCSPLPPIPSRWRSTPRRIVVRRKMRPNTSIFRADSKRPLHRAALR